VRDSPNFPIHPELILWSVPGEGFLMRVLVREMFAYDPSLFDLNQQALLAHAPDPNDVHYVTDSDDVFALSFAPLAKDIEWYERPQRLDAPKIGSWWLRYDSPANDLIARRYFYIHSATRTPQKWRRPELESDALMRRIKGSREILRLLSAIGQKDFVFAKQVLAFALAETKLASMIDRIGPVTLLIPHDGAMQHWLTGAGEEMLDLRPSRRLVDLILDHVVVGRVPLEVGKNAVLRTVRDGERSLTWRNNTPLVDDAVLQPPAFPVAHDWTYVTDVWALTTDQVLAPSRGALRRSCCPGVAPTPGAPVSADGVTTIAGAR
jgi:Fasciclin domain